MVDLLIHDEGSVVAFRPMTDKGRQWIDDNVCSEPWQWLGNTLAVDHRYAPEMVRGAIADGLCVEANSW